MKLVNSAILLIVLLSTINIFSQPKDRYEIESFYAEKNSKTVTAGTEVTTSEKIYYSNGVEARYITETTNISMMGQDHSTVSKKVIITNPEWIVSYNPETLEGTKMKNTVTDKFSGMSEDDMNNMAEQMGEAMKTNVKDGGTGTVADKECKITIAETDLMGMITTSKIWTYKNYQMKVESNTSGNIVHEEVTKFDEGVEIDPKKLEVSSKVTLKEFKSPF